MRLALARTGRPQAYGQLAVINRLTPKPGPLGYRIQLTTSRWAGKHGLETDCITECEFESEQMASAPEFTLVARCYGAALIGGRHPERMQHFANHRRHSGIRLGSLVS